MPAPNIDPIIAANIAAAVTQDGRSDRAISLALGHRANWLNRIRNGRKGLTFAGLRALAAELGVTAGSLVDP